MNEQKTSQQKIPKQGKTKRQRLLKSKETEHFDICNTSDSATDLPNRDLTGDKRAKSLEQKAIVIIGDSIIKHIDPKKLSRRTLHKFTYPGKTCNEVNMAIDDIQETIDPSHVIIHCETNNLDTDSAKV